MNTEKCRIEAELNEQFKARLGDDPTNPRTKMVHLAHATIELATMMCAIRLEVEASRAERRPTIVVAYENIFQPEIFHARLALVFEYGPTMG